MELYEVMLKRRSIRKYTPEKISEETLQKILEAGLLVPSSKASYAMELIPVCDPGTVRRMADARDGSAAMLKEAACAVVVVGDPEKTDAWIEDCSLSMAYMQLRATELGVGTCWIQGRNRTSAVQRGGRALTTEEFLRELLHIPERYRVEAILSMGMPTREMPAHDPAQLKREKIHREGF